MKVMVIDDEPNIRDGLKTLIDWEKLHCILVGEAQNGIEGIEKILLLRPDLIIVDIKMPEIDGIQLIEKITHMGIETQFIVLSGYQDFNYAKRAMECHVNHYILKPIDEEILAQKVIEIYTSWFSKIKKQLDLEHQCQLSKEQMIKYIAMGHETMDPYLDSTNGYEELNRWYDLKLPWQSYTVLLLDTLESGMNFKERNLVKQHLNETGSYKVYFETDGFLGMLIKNREFDKHCESLQCLRKWVNLQFHREAIITIGITVNELNEVSKSYAFAKYLMDHRFLYGNQTILQEQSIYQQQNNQQQNKQQNNQQDKSYEEDTEVKLYQSVCTNQQDQVNNLLEGMRAYMEASGWDSERIKAFYLHVYVSVMASLIEHQHGLLEREFLNPKVFETLYQQSNLFKLHGFVKFQLLTICEYIEEMKPQKTLSKVLDYMEHHYQEDIKIEALGKLFHYSSNYLGKQLKKETGKTFNVLLDEVRLKNAKILLNDPDRKIYEIAQITGFHDPDYFTAKFRKYFGISPKEYRTIHT
jgi:two-component system response regulator YesN